MSGGRISGRGHYGTGTERTSGGAEEGGPRIAPGGERRTASDKGGGWDRREAGGRGIGARRVDRGAADTGNGPGFGIGEEGTGEGEGNGALCRAWTARGTPRWEESEVDGPWRGERRRSGRETGKGSGMSADGGGRVLGGEGGAETGPAEDRGSRGVREEAGTSGRESDARVRGRRSGGQPASRGENGWMDGEPQRAGAGRRRSISRDRGLGHRRVAGMERRGRTAGPEGTPGNGSARWQGSGEERAGDGRGGRRRGRGGRRLWRILGAGPGRDGLSGGETAGGRGGDGGRSRG